MLYIIYIIFALVGNIILIGVVYINNKRWRNFIMSSKCTINGKSITFPEHCNTISINDNQILIDEKEVHEFNNEPTIKIEIKSCCISNLETTSGDIRISGDVGGHIKTVSGDVIAKSVGGVRTISGGVVSK